MVADRVDDPFNLQRFVEAQDGVYASVLDELRDGRKKSHWMWFIFPQIRGLGTSAMAQRYAIASLAEARAYVEHPLLGPRLRECTGLALGHPHRSVADIFGFPDDRKFHSSMTLFSKAVAQEEVFARALVQYFDSKEDAKTIALIAQ